MDKKVVTIAGVTLKVDSENFGSFSCFDADYALATDLGPGGMVEEMKAFKRLTKGMKCLVDAGALFGIFSLVFTEDAAAMAHAIEPSSSAFPILVEICDANPGHRVIPMQIFAGDIDGLTVPCGQVWKHVMPGGDGEQTTQTVTTIDSLSLDPDCLKIDVESYECSVLRGARETVRRCHPLIFLEVHCNDLWRHGETVDSLARIIKDMGYVLEDFTGHPTTLPQESMTRVVCRPQD